MSDKALKKMFRWYDPCPRCPIKGEVRGCVCGVKLQIDSQKDRDLSPLTWKR